MPVSRFACFSLARARTREAIHNGWDKNDPKDARVILHMLRTGLTQRYHDPRFHGLNDIQELSKTHEAISKAKTEVLHCLLTQLRYPANSIALPIPPDAEAIAMFRLVIAEVLGLIRTRDRIEGRAQALLGSNPDYQRLLQIPGIGPIHALTVLAEAGDLRRFGHHRQFLKFCGLDLATYQSGKYRGQTRLSKFGNARLRRAMWLAAQVAIRQKENSFRDKFERYIAEDRRNADLNRKALSAVAAKMARVVHAVINSGRDYRPFIEVAMPSGRTPFRPGP